MIKNFRNFSPGFQAMREIMETAIKEIRKGDEVPTMSQLINVSPYELQIAINIINSPRTILKEIEFVYGFRNFSIYDGNKVRKISSPHPEVQKVFVKIKDFLERNSVPHPQMYAFIKKRNCKKALETFLDGQKYFFSFDIKKAFESSTKDMVKQILPQLQVPELIVESLARLVTMEHDETTSLPVGASCSPLFLNLIFTPICEEINKICIENKITWFVYADDFNFASLEKIPESLKTILLSIPLKYGLKINPKKTKDNFGKTIPHALGLTISLGQLHIKRRTKKKFRRILYAEKKFKAYGENVIGGMKQYVQHIYGHIPNWMA